MSFSQENVKNSANGHVLPQTEKFKSLSEKVIENMPTNGNFQAN
jgi:hypothetical protein